MAFFDEMKNRVTQASQSAAKSAKEFSEITRLNGEISDAESRIVTQQRRIGDGKEAQLIDGVAGVGNDFTQEHFLVGIQGLGKQGQKLGDFGLKTMDFSSHFLFHLLNQKFTKSLQKRRQDAASHCYAMWGLKRPFSRPIDDKKPGNSTAAGPGFDSGSR